jgi:transposase
MKILALDLGKFNSVSCLYDTETQSAEFWTCATNRSYLRTLFLKYQPDLIVFESCSISGWVHDLCSECELRTLVADPNQEAWKWKNVKRKTDRDDALKLARLAALGQLVSVHIPAQPTREHRWLVKYRKTLVGRVTRIQNNIRALFVQHGLKMPAGARAWTAAGLEQIGAERRPLTDCSIDQLWRGQLDMELAELERQREALRQVDHKLDALAEQDERIELLTTVPGVGRKTAEVIATHLDQPTRFKSARHVSSYAGLVPRRWQSGQMDHSGRVTKRGSRLLRSALVEAAWVMLRYNDWARTLFLRICQGQKSRRKKAIVAIGRKLLVRCWAMLRDNRPWQLAASD